MKNPIFTLPPIAEIAQNALTAHFQNRLQATTTKAMPLAGYYNRDTDTCCVVGASIPPDIAGRLDKEEYPAIGDLIDTQTVATTGFAAAEKLRYLQRLHDGIVTMRMQGPYVTPRRLAEAQQKLLDYLKRLAGGRP
jgi:hypothetical protein